MKEYEKKIMLTEYEYMILTHTVSKYKVPEIQVNYYFDTNSFFMNKKGVTYRIRFKDDTYTATIKNHYTGKENLSIETIVDVSKEFNEKIFNDSFLELQGELRTERTTMFDNVMYRVYLDKNIYLDTIDYELEIEYNEGNDALANEVLEYIFEILEFKGESIKSEIEKRYSLSKSKSQRFIERKTSLDKEEKS